MNTFMEKHQYIEWAKEVFNIEAKALHEVSKSLNQHFVEAVDAILECSGRVVIMGVGKSGHIGHKIAATLASTGTPAFFVHPTEAAHGDLGMIVDGDVVIGISNSGESDELLAIIPALKRKNIQLIAITARIHSSLAQYADICMLANISQEACPLGLAPTSSTTATLALGDALAVALLQARQFTPDDFALSHPAGSLGKRLLLTVGNIMHTGDELPMIQQTATFKEMIIHMSERGLGMLGIVDEENHLVGIFTDGDLRRLFQTRDSFDNIVARDVMYPNPKAIRANMLATEAVKLMQTKHINGLLVVDENNRLIGALNMHDLFKARVI